MFFCAPSAPRSSRRRPPPLPRPPAASSRAARAAEAAEPSASCPEAARQRLLQDFTFGYRQDPSLPLQLWLDGATDGDGVRDRLAALEAQRQGCAARGLVGEPLWEVARTAALTPPPYEAAIQRAGELMLTEGATPLFVGGSPNLSFACLIMASAAHAPALDLGHLGLDVEDLRGLQPLLAGLPRLETLSLQSNRLDAGAMGELVRLALLCPRLIRLDLAGNALSESAQAYLNQVAGKHATDEDEAGLAHRALNRRTWSRLSLDAPLQASLGRSGLKLAGRLRGCPGLARVRGLDLEGVVWRDHQTLTDGLEALAGARNLWFLRLRLEAASEATGSWWEPALTRLARLPSLQVLHLADSPLAAADDVLAFDHHVGALLRLQILALGHALPAWAEAPDGHESVKVLADILSREEVVLLPSLSRQPDQKGLVPHLATAALCQPEVPLRLAGDLLQACKVPADDFVLYPPGTRVSDALTVDGGPLDSALLRASLYPGALAELKGFTDLRLAAAGSAPSASSVGTRARAAATSGPLRISVVRVGVPQ